MDPKHFDTIARAAADPRSRRQLLHQVLGGALGVGLTARMAEVTARHRHHHHHGHHGGGGGCIPQCLGAACGADGCGGNCGTCPEGQVCQGGVCIDGGGGGGSSCDDGVQNGTETDVDCGGGTCRRCALDQRCQVANDCASGTCATGRCVACTPTQLCGSDGQGTCRCDAAFPSGEPVCDAAGALGFTVDDCAKCPADTQTCVTINGLLFNCYVRCGSTA